MNQLINLSYEDQPDIKFNIELDINDIYKRFSSLQWISGKILGTEKIEVKEK